jgi:hypothetical protein
MWCEVKHVLSGKALVGLKADVCRFTGLQRASLCWCCLCNSSMQAPRCEGSHVAPTMANYQLVMVS